MEVKKWRFFITPVPHIRITSNETWMFAKKKPISDEYLKAFGAKKRKEDIEKGVKSPRTANAYLNRRNTIKKYWNYKLGLKAVADLEKFEMPKMGTTICFFMPMPKSWSKKKRRDMSFELHTFAPDVDNLYKGFSDSILRKDQIISDFRATKLWYDSPNGKGFIEITVGELPPVHSWQVRIGGRVIIQDDKIK